MECQGAWSVTFWIRGTVFRLLSQIRTIELKVVSPGHLVVGHFPLMALIDERWGEEVGSFPLFLCREFWPLRPLLSVMPCLQSAEIKCLMVKSRWTFNRTACLSLFCKHIWDEVFPLPTVPYLSKVFLCMPVNLLGKRWWLSKYYVPRKRVLTTLSRWQFQDVAYDRYSNSPWLP